MAPAHDDAHEKRDRDRRPDREGPPGRLRERIDDHEAEDRDQDDHDEEDAERPRERADRTEIVAG